MVTIPDSLRLVAGSFDDSEPAPCYIPSQQSVASDTPAPALGGFYDLLRYYRDEAPNMCDV